LKKYCLLLYLLVYNVVNATLILPIAQIKEFVIPCHEHFSQSEMNVLAANFSLGSIYTKKSRNDLAYGYFYFCKNFLELKNCKSSPFYSASISQMAWLLYELEDYEAVKDLLLDWHKHPIKLELEPYNVYNTLGLAYFKLKDYEKALFFYDLAFKYAAFHRNAFWVSWVNMNRAAMHFEKEEYAEAKTLIKKEIQASENHRQHRHSFALSYLHLANIALIEDSVPLSHSYIERAYTLTHEYNMEPNALYHDVKSMYFTKTNNLDSVRFHVKRKDALRSELRETRRKSMNLLLQAVESAKNAALYNTQKKTDEINSKFTANTWLMILLTLGLGSWLLYKSKKYRRDNRKFEEEISIADQELRQKKEEVERLKQKVQEEEALLKAKAWKTEIKEKSSNSGKFGEGVQVTYNELIHIKLTTPEGWLEFKTKFSEAYPNYIDHLLEQQPALTPAELRLICLIRLNLTQLEMADLLGVSPNSVKQGQLRLKKKLEFEKQEELKAFIYGIKT